MERRAPQKFTNPKGVEFGLALRGTGVPPVLSHGQDGHATQYTPALMQHRYKTAFDPFGVDWNFIGWFLSVGFTYG